LTITVGDVNEGPEAISFTGGDVAEDALPGSVVASVSVADQDVGDSFTYELVDNAGGRFEVDSDGNIVVSGETGLDYEFDTSHTVVVRVTDSGGETIEQSLEISVTNATELESEDSSESVEETETGAEQRVERAQPYSADVSQQQGEAAGQSMPDYQEVGYEAEAVDLDASGAAAEQTLQWVADEVAELTEIADSIESFDIGLQDGTDSGDETNFEDAFVPLEGDSEVDPEAIAADEELVQEARQDGFLSKFWVMLRAGLGTTNRVDDNGSASAGQDRGAGFRSRRK